MRCIGFSSELSYIRQDGSLHDYIDRFDYLASSVSYTSDYHLPGIFINGLQYELQSEVRDGLKRLWVFDLEGVKKLALEAEEKLAELDRLAEIKKHRMISSRKSERYRASNGSTYQSDVGGLNRVEEDPWKKFDSILERMRERIKGSKTNSCTHIDAAPSLQEAGMGSMSPLMESSRKQFENLSNGRSEKFKQLSAVDFQFRRDKGLCFKCDERFDPNHMCHSEKVEHIGGIGSVLEGESIEKSGTVIDEKPSEEVEAVELVITNEDEPTSNVIAFSDPREQVENGVVSIKAECNKMKSKEVDIVEYIAVEDDEPLPLMELEKNRIELDCLVILRWQNLEVYPTVISWTLLTQRVGHHSGFASGRVVLWSVLLEISLGSFQLVVSVGYLDEAWDFIRTIPFKLGISFEAIFIFALPR